MPATPPTGPAPRAPHSMSRRQALEGWENEGGHTRPQAVPALPALPAGITVRTEPHYLVGRYRYTELGLACAELARQAAAAPGRAPGPEGSSQDSSDGNPEHRS